MPDAIPCNANLQQTLRYCTSTQSVLLLVPCALVPCALAVVSKVVVEANSSDYASVVHHLRGSIGIEARAWQSAGSPHVTYLETSWLIAKDAPQSAPLSGRVVSAVDANAEAVASALRRGTVIVSLHPGVGSEGGALAFPGASAVAGTSGEFAFDESLPPGIYTARVSLAPGSGITALANGAVSVLSHDANIVIGVIVLATERIPAAPAPVHAVLSWDVGWSMGLTATFANCEVFAGRQRCGGAAWHRAVGGRSEVISFEAWAEDAMYLLSASFVERRCAACRAVSHHVSRRTPHPPPLAKTLPHPAHLYLRLHCIPMSVPFYL